MNDPKPILYRRHLMERYQISRGTTYAWQAKGLIPRPDIVMGDKVGWYAATILEAERLSAEQHAA
jgi:predicted DNA-binding transcriptional regulator AlpA